MNTENHLMIEQQGKLGMITLDRVTHLNALSLDMIKSIGAQLELWRNDAAVQAVLIKSNSPKAFCAGGDIRYLYDSYKNGTADYKGYFSAEYKMLNILREYEKPIIVVLDGYVLGGGFGLAQACHIVVSSEKSRFAMPETAIGFFPDVGATHFLSRLDDIGVYMAITGEQISSSDALYLDLIDYHVPSDQ
ncbi:enoyl-CoA hydratase/isomerase family protein, partial [Acinetobacter baumannii]